MFYRKLMHSVNEYTLYNTPDCMFEWAKNVCMKQIYEFGTNFSTKQIHSFYLQFELASKTNTHEMKMRLHAQIQTDNLRVNLYKIFKWNTKWENMMFCTNWTRTILFTGFSMINCSVQNATTTKVHVHSFFLTLICNENGTHTRQMNFTPSKILTL